MSMEAVREVSCFTYLYFSTVFGLVEVNRGRCDWAPVGYEAPSSRLIGDRCSAVAKICIPDKRIAFHRMKAFLLESEPRRFRLDVIEKLRMLS